MKIVLQLTSAGGDVELVTIVASESFTVPEGMTVEIVLLEGVSDLNAEGGELVLSGPGGTIRVAGLGADFLAETASIDGVGIDGPLPAGFARFFSWADTSDRSANGTSFGETSEGQDGFTPGADNLPPPLDSSNEILTPAPEAPSISSFSEDTGVSGDGITADNTIALSGEAEANATVTIFDGETELGSVTADADGNWSFTTDVLADGAYRFTATATNEGGTGAASEPVDVIVDTLAPGITIAAPVSADGIVGSADDGALTVSGTAAGGSEVFVTFRDGSGATVTGSVAVDSV